jgi:hypothetical protein
MRHVNVLAAPALVLVALLAPADCHTNTAVSPAAACETAYRREYRKALDEQSDGHRPRACRGLDKATLRRIAVKVIEEESDPPADFGED